MADIEMVIKIPGEDYETLMNINDDRLPSIIARKHLYNALANGTPLPKGHGRLIDADELLETWYDNFCNFMTQTELDSMNNIIKNAQTIIEADKAESEV